MSILLKLAQGRSRTVTIRKPKPKWFKMTEKLLYDYKTFESAIRNIEAELEAIMPQVSSSLVVIGREATKALFESQTEAWAIKRAESPRARLLYSMLREKKRWRAAIKKIRAKLTEEENTLVWLRYDIEKPHDEVIYALGERGFPRSRRGYFNLRRQVVEKVAKRMGFL